MNTNAIITAAIGAFIAVLVVLSVAAPIIHAGTAETLTYTNEGMPYAAVDDGEHTILIDADSINVDNVELDLDLFPAGFNEYTLVYGESSFIRINVQNDNIRACSASFKQYNMTHGETVTISLNGSNVTVSSSDTSVESTSYNDAEFYISSVGDYVLSANPTVNPDTVMYGAGSTNFGASVWNIPATGNIYVIWEGTTSAITGTVIRTDPTATYSGATVSSINVNSTEIYDDLVQIDSVIVNYDLTDTDSTTYDVYSTYTYFLAPASVEYDNPNYIDATVTTIAGILPVLMIVGVMLFVVGAMISNRRA